MKNQRNSIALALALLLISILMIPLPVSAEDKPVLRVGILPVVEELPIVISKKEVVDPIRESEVHIEVFQSWTALEAAFRTGMVDIAGMSLIKALKMAYQGVPLQMLLQLHQDGSALVLTCPDTAEGLKGKIIGVTGNDTGQLILLDAYLKSKDLRLGFDVRYITIPLRRATELMKAGKIDGFLFPEPYATMAEQTGGVTHYIGGHSIMPEYMDVVLIVNPATKKRYPAAIKELVTSIKHAGAFIENDKANGLKQVAILQQDIMGFPAKTMQAALVKQSGSLSFKDMSLNQAEIERFMKLALGLEMLGGSDDVASLIAQ